MKSVFSLRWIHTQTHSHPKKHTSQNYRSGSVEKEAGWTLSWESNGQREMRSRRPPCRKRGQHVATQRCGWRAGTGRGVAEARQWLLMRDHSAISNAMTASGGALVSLQMEGNHQSGRVLVEKQCFGGLVSIRKRSKFHCFCMKVKWRTREIAKTYVTNRNWLILFFSGGWGERDGTQVWLELWPFAYHHPDQV